MEDSKKITKTVKEPTVNELKEQLMNAQQTIMAIKTEAAKRIEAMNYSNAFQQQQFMLEIVKMHNVFPVAMVDKAIHAIDNFWFEEPKEDVNDAK